jgi:hypothetical protein
VRPTCIAATVSAQDTGHGHRPAQARRTPRLGALGALPTLLVFIPARKFFSSDSATHHATVTNTPIAPTTPSAYRRRPLQSRTPQSRALGVPTCALHDDDTRLPTFRRPLASFNAHRYPAFARSAGIHAGRHAFSGVESGVLWTSQESEDGRVAVVDVEAGRRGGGIREEGDEDERWDQVGPRWGG